MLSIKKYLYVIRAVVFISTALAILILSLVPQPPEIIKEFSLSDKVMHLFAYIALAFTILSSTLFGGLIELLQGFTGRSPELLDLLFDTAGAAIGVLLYFTFNKAVYYYKK